MSRGGVFGLHSLTLRVVAVDPILSLAVQDGIHAGWHPYFCRLVLQMCLASSPIAPSALSAFRTVRWGSASRRLRRLAALRAAMERLWRPSRSLLKGIAGVAGPCSSVMGIPPQRVLRTTVSTVPLKIQFGRPPKSHQKTCQNKMNF